MISHNEFITNVAKAAEGTKGDAKRYYNAMYDVLVETLRNGDSCRLFGTTFSTEVKAEHLSRNPRTGETITVPEKVYLRTKNGATLKKAIAR